MIFRFILMLALAVPSFVTVREFVSQAAEAATTVPRFEPAPCAKIQGLGWLAHASCGYLVVAEDHSKPNGRTIELMVTKYSARSAQKRPDPVLYLEGGPGDIAQLEANEIIKADFIRDRDIWIVSQRGTWSSKPALICAATNDFTQALLGLRYYSETTKLAHVAATQACRNQLAATGADFGAYNSSQSADDLADLR
ncbi:MAG TPA: hypothetical protein VN936_09765, partial [Candidatus Acidoferrum sp.]|nr:hypothetical protein [Candidatus Acidoferrum sp.]